MCAESVQVSGLLHAPLPPLPTVHYNCHMLVLVNWPPHALDKRDSAATEIWPLDYFPCLLEKQVFKVTSHVSVVRNVCNKNPVGPLSYVSG